MNCLAFDTCFDACSAAVSQGRSESDRVTHHRYQAMVRGHAEHLVPMIAEVMAESRLTFASLDRIGVTVGPGSFTGARIGVAAARSFALANDIPLVGLSSLAVMALQAASSPCPAVDAAEAPAAVPRPILVAVDVRRGEVYVQIFDATGYLALSQPEVCSVVDAAQMAQVHAARVVGSGATAVVAATGMGCRCIADLPQLQPDARAAVMLVSLSRLTTRSVSPLYLRAPDAKPPIAAPLLRH